MTANLLQSTFLDNVSTGTLTFVLGIVIIFLGMTVLVLAVSLMGSIMTKIDEKKAQKVKEEKDVEVTSFEEEQSDEIPEHVKVAIVAAIAAYYADSGVKNEFKVRKIKKI